MTSPDRSPGPVVPLSQALIGTWELLSREDHDAEGRRHPDPLLGSDPVAWLVYDRAGHFAAQFMKRDRTSVPVAVAGPSANNTAARDGYDAYFGTYTVDDTRGTVTQRLIGALSPANVGMELTRAMQVVNGELVIRLATTSVEGVAVTRTLRWRRID